MSDWRATEPGMIGCQDIQTTSTVQKHRLGQTVKAHDFAATDYGDGEFIYAIGVASTVVGSLALIDSGDYVTALGAAGNVGSFGTSMSINVASQYGWYQIAGRGVVKGLAALADVKVMYLTATAGSVDDAVVAGDDIHGMDSTSALDTPSTGLAEVTLNRPYCSSV
jgi:hypothetical protein